MKRRMLVVAISLFVPSLAAAQGPTAEELTVRPGDTITWTTSQPHQLRFGGSVTHNKKPLALTPFDDVKKILDFDVQPTIDAQGVARWPSGKPVKATVRADAAKSGIKEFFFTCGFNLHADMMVTASFTVDAAGAGTKALAINSANPPKWVLKTATGDKDLKRP